MELILGNFNGEKDSMVDDGKIDNPMLFYMIFASAYYDILNIR